MDTLPLLPLAPLAPNPHFARLGGEAAVARLVEAFYAAMDSRADAREIRAMHARDLSATKAVLRLYLAEWMGGPRRYSPERGTPRLGRVHKPFALRSADADAWLACMQQALDETCADAALRAELMAAFAKIARHLSSAHS